MNGCVLLLFLLFVFVFVVVCSSKSNKFHRILPMRYFQYTSPYIHLYDTKTIKSRPFHVNAYLSPISPQKGKIQEQMVRFIHSFAPFNVLNIYVYIHKVYLFVLNI